ncbi:hypothetical protein [uncultured Tateyamaria sp.]|uniref:SGNH/GDSL hydrolase family protein n=1 Tax=uncultured Tateyamaria sp. TaxID=455651 RepID=UPI002636AC8F|nr:hypothetical protein [uncultured Tateyamaria sp.]
MDFLASKTVTKPRLLFRPDPVLGWAFTPGFRVDLKGQGKIIQTIDDAGWRVVPGQPSGPAPRVAVYGCSFTYGARLQDDETFCARAQQTHPDLRILNRGISGHGTVQNLLQFRRDVARGAVDAAVFAVFSDHRYRNVPHPHRMEQFLSPEWYRQGIEHIPVLRHGADGQAAITYVPIWQPITREADLAPFLPDPGMLGMAMQSVLAMVRDTARAAQVPLRIVLLDQLDMAFNAWMLQQGGDVVDISTPSDPAHTFLPDDAHPNAHANALYAERLAPVLADLRAEGGI